MENEMILEFDAKSENEFFARAVIGCFMLRLNPSVADIADVKTAVSEAVTNSIVHGYKNKIGIVYITVHLCENRLVRIEIKDKGCGIEDVARARQPLFTTDAENERSGMGFTVMESFCDKVKVFSKEGKGTTVTLFKRLEGR